MSFYPTLAPLSAPQLSLCTETEWWFPAPTSGGGLDPHFLGGNVFGVEKQLYRSCKDLQRKATLGTPPTLGAIPLL